MLGFAAEQATGQRRRTRGRRVIRAHAVGAPRLRRLRPVAALDLQPAPLSAVESVAPAAAVHALPMSRAVVPPEPLVGYVTHVA
eukprot:Transcript_19270.p4 GENE.Transcript_19270~~Transcript_19270.p4  ORF type:complete len:84 (-),score=11.17 Transcript_19270:435-686(-)